MTKATVTLLTLLVLSAAAHGSAGAGRFELLSRSVLEGPSMSGAFVGGGFILGTGGGIVFFKDTAKTSEKIFLTIEGEPRDIAVRGSAAYIAANAGGLVTVDLSDPSAPKTAASFAKSHRAVSCAVFGTTLILADNERILFTFDISRPLEPVLRGTERLTLAPLWVGAEGDLVAVITSRKGFIYTAAPDGRLERRCEIAFPENMKRAVIHDRILYAIELTGGALRWDLDSPELPASLGPLPVDGAEDISFCGSRGLVLTKANTIVPIEVGPAQSGAAGETGRGRGVVTPGRPLRPSGFPPERSKGSTVLAKIRHSLSHGRIPGSSLEFDGSRCATIAGKNGVFFFTIEGETARFTGNLPTPGFAVDLTAGGGLVYVANSNDGVRIGEVHDDGTVDWIGHIQTTEARDVVLDGTLLALCDGSGGFKTIDVSDPRNPRIVGARTSPFYNSALVVRDRRAYIAGGLGGVEVIDFTHATAPKLVWRQEFSEVRGIDVDSHYLYFADGFEGFRIFSLEGDKPLSVSVLDTEGWNCDCFVLGDVAYLADGGNGLKVADIADRAHPVLLGAVKIHSITRNLYAVPGMVFAAVQVGGIAAIDVSDPTAPFIAARCQTVDDGRGVWVDDRFVYLASGSGGVYVFRYQH